MRRQNPLLRTLKLLSQIQSQHTPRSKSLDGILPVLDNQPGCHNPYDKNDDNTLRSGSTGTVKTPTYALLATQHDRF